MSEIVCKDSVCRDYDMQIGVINDILLVLMFVRLFIFY